MKKRNLITFMLLLVMLPCAMLFNGCSDKDQLSTKATLNTGKESNYVALEDNNTFVDYLGAETTTADMQSYRFTMVVVSTDDDGKKSKATMNAICQFNDEDYTASKLAVKISTGGEYINMYITDGYVYMNTKAQSMNVKMKMALSSLDSFDSYTGEFNFDLEDIYDILNNADGQVAVSFYEDNYTKYYKLSETISADEINDYYFVFENDILSGIKYNVTNEEGEMTLTLAKYDGTISFPDFSDYIDPSAM